MKKLMVIIFVFILCLPACNSKEKVNKELEEQLKAELKEELRKELETKETQQEAQGKEQDSSDETCETEQQKVYILEGILMPAFLPFGDAILLEEPITFKRIFDTSGYDVKVDESRIVHTRDVYIYDTGGIDLYSYISRQDLIFDGAIITVAEHTKIPIKVKLDFTDFLALRDPCTDDGPWGTLIELIEINGSSELVDMSHTSYTATTCKDIFEEYIKYAIESNDGFVPEDVRDLPLYSTETLFRDSIDDLIEMGYYFNMGEGEYYIDTERKVYADGEPTWHYNMGGLYRWLSFNVTDFKETIKPTSLKIRNEWDDAIGCNMVITELEYNGLRVWDVLLEDVPKEQVYKDSIERFTVTSNNFVIDHNLSIGMSIKEAFDYCKRNYEPFINLHGDGVTPEEYIFTIPDTQYCISFNGYKIEDAVDLNQKVESIEIYHHNTTIGV